MKTATLDEFLGTLKNGDIGLINSKNFFGFLQNLYRKRFKEGPEQASHSFFMKSPPEISEANGFTVSGGSSVLKFVGDSTKCWIFRFKALTDRQLEQMNDFAAGAEETSGHYSFWGIAQFAKAFILGKRDEKDESGVFCSEYTSRIICAAGINEYCDLPSYQIDPSFQLNWLLEASGWDLVASYDPVTGYQIS